MTDDGDLIGGRYRLRGQVGIGAMGIVWRADDEVLRRIVAVKELLLHSAMSESQTHEAQRRAMREGRIAARLHHPHAISVYDVVEHEGRPCLIMEYLPSQSLADLLAARHTLPAAEVARIGDQIGSALAAAHVAGIVHRDVKPGNVLLGADGTAKLTDFGISRAVGDGTVTATGVLAGTPAYLAPEVAQGHDAGFPSDVFSLGATLYSAVEGAPPFGVNDNAIALLHRIATLEATPPRQAGPLAPVLLRMLDRDPKRRPTMPEARAALAAVAAANPAGAEPIPAEPTPADPIPAEPVPADPIPAEPTPAEPIPAKPTARQVPAGPSTPARRRRLIVAGLAVAALATTAVLVATMNGGTPAAGHANQSSANPPSAGRSSAAGPTATTGAPNSPPPPQNPTATTGSPAPTDAAGQLSAAITDYYALMPTRLSEAFTLMTADYQQNHAGGFSGYQRFWQPVQRVTVSNVSPRPPGSVDATIDYYYRDGHVVEERTSFGLVNENGGLKIASSSVLSSRRISG